MTAENADSDSGTSVSSGAEDRHDRAHKYWQSLLSSRPMPTIADLSADRLNEFKDYSFLIAIKGSSHSPVVSFAGKEIYVGTGVEGIKAGASLDAISADSMLAQLRAEFESVQDKSSPVNFNMSSNSTSELKGIVGSLMPFGTDGVVQFIWGVVSTSPQQSSADMGATFDGVVEPAPQGDGQATESFAEKERESGFDEYVETFEGEAYELSNIVTQERSDLGIGEVPADIYLGFDDRADSFEGEAYEMSDVVTEENSIVFYDEETDFDLNPTPENGEGFAGSIAEVGEETGFDGAVEVDVEIEVKPTLEPAEVEPEPLEPEIETEPEPKSEEEPAPPSTPTASEGGEDKDVPLFNILADGRTAADGVVHVDQRSRLSLYEVLAKAYALYEESQGDRDTYLSILKATGIGEQSRAPFTPIIKLVFGKNFDKTRITEYAAALSYARRNKQTSESLPEFLANTPGGIKGCVHAERVAKRKEKGIAGDVALETAKEKLRHEKAICEVEIEGVEEEFVLLLGKKTESGTVEIIKPLKEKNSFVDPMIKRAVKPN